MHDSGKEANNTAVNIIGKPESKTRRLGLLFRPATAEGLQAAADSLGVSVNDLLHQLADNYLKNRREQGR
ncbi:MAG: hypothetical protein LBI42_03955 [Chitinispirillales bacterium]|nr:hypothetical protein [Chitinispirillales bacterium]